jgi:preprotein translocase subunit SecA
MIKHIKLDMFDWIVQKFFGTKNERELKKYYPLVRKISELEPEIVKLSDDELKGKTAIYREKINEIYKQYEDKKIAEERVKDYLDSILPEAFAVVRETGRRVVNMRHFDVQILGGIILHKGNIAEMKTGEGKTLVATLPAYLNALDSIDENGNPRENRGVHIVTVNDYLAKRDREWMGKIFEFLGLTVGFIQHEMEDKDRQAAYNCDITYGTNNEFGFDYLRDNMKYYIEELVQRGHNFAIVDEVDSILIDEARTPLIISGPTEENVDLYYKVDRFVRPLKKSIITNKEQVSSMFAQKKEPRKQEGDYEVDEKSKTVALTEEGIAKAEKYFKMDNIYDIKHMELVSAINQALKAHSLFERDVDYMVKDGQVVIVDEFTGRLMPGRRYSEGLHQALEAKEGVRVQEEYQTLASITFQNYFRMYRKLSGMTGTAETEAAEFLEIYKLPVLVIPTNKKLIRKEFDDEIYRTPEEKWDAVVEDIKEHNDKGQPMLVGTVSIEKSEKLSRLLKRRKVKHVVLNAKFHEKEAEIVAQAGRIGAVTIATNMAGRGTDILLGGNPEFLAKEYFKKKGKKLEDISSAEWEKTLKEFEEKTKIEHDKVLELGGLYVIGTERHEARRIDNQLRGRCGRQGDPGMSKFFLSLGDDLMRIWGADRLSRIMQLSGLQEGEPIKHKMVSNAIERAQKQIEAQNFSIRKHLLEYDDVMNKQREVIYSMRKAILEGKSQKDYFNQLTEDILYQIGEETNINRETFFEDWDWERFKTMIRAQFFIDPDMLDIEKEGLDGNEYLEQVLKKLHEIYESKENIVGDEQMREIERVILLQTIDTRWKEHLLAMDHLKEGIGLRGYGQRDPLVEYKREGFDMFQHTINIIEEESLKILFSFTPVPEEEIKREIKPKFKIKGSIPKKKKKKRR